MESFKLLCVCVKGLEEFSERFLLGVGFVKGSCWC